MYARSESSEQPRSPEDWPRVFARRVEAGDLDAVVALYHPDARFVTPSGETLAGRERIRTMLAALLAAKAHMEPHVVQAVVVGDTAILYTDFHNTMLDASGRQMQTHNKAIEVLRRQPDGTWLLIVGDPDGRTRCGRASSAAELEYLATTQLVHTRTPEP